MNVKSNQKISWYFLISALFILSIGIVFYSNKSFSISKQEMIEIAKSHHCPLRINFIYGDDVSYYDRCISVLKNDFSKLSNSDKKEITIKFVIDGSLDAGASGEFIELIKPSGSMIIKDLENISSTELQEKFGASPSEIVAYRKMINHYKTALENHNTDSK